MYVHVREVNESSVLERFCKSVVTRMYTRRSYKKIKDKSIFHLIPSRVTTDPTHTCKSSCLAAFPFRIIPSLYLFTYFHRLYNLHTKQMQSPFCYTSFSYLTFSRMEIPVYLTTDSNIWNHKLLLVWSWRQTDSGSLWVYVFCPYHSNTEPSPSPASLAAHLHPSARLLPRRHAVHT